jgi:hypothetical protein
MHLTTVVHKLDKLLIYGPKRLWSAREMISEENALHDRTASLCHVGSSTLATFAFTLASTSIVGHVSQKRDSRFS